ncbi:hypothetical protein DM02DRAFT_159775 [Periconia macrospinosa]|uniref:C2H2-type domain-containing protein n=1 Tax=Periconia macrospinosa TaxID=97972 RepID=A0A2V1E2B2_9PLEO|nr:hypothetical protein DM02DRAFT_159775 [Periconia macrospinosa]
MSIRSPDGALSSASFFDVFPEEVCTTSNQTVDIAKWREDISGLSTSGTSFYSQAPDSSMTCRSEADVKDNTSEYSMDSAYHSQAGTDQRTTMTSDGFQWPSDQVFSFEGSSPLLGSDNFTPFSGSQDMDQLHLSPTAGAMDAGAQSYDWSANNSLGQDFFNFQPTNMSQYSTMDTQYDLGLWSSVYSTNQDITGTEVFNSPAQLQQPQNMNSIGVQYQGVRASVQPSTLATPVATPINTQHQVESRTKVEESSTKSLGAPSLADEDEGDDEDIFSPLDPETNRIQEEHRKVARTHPLYTAKPKEDGNFHCPFEGQPGCNHKPTDLKCNHDKYVDSHLKPYRCNREGCPNVQFSSTACLLRHEREAHALHGHGKNPNLCYYTDCERAMAGNGFRRRYNLFDHMKRVHDYTGPTNDASTSPSAESQAAKGRGVGGRRKRSATDIGVQKKHKVTKATARKHLQQQQQQQEQQKQQHRARIQEHFTKTRKSIIDLLNALNGPDDLATEQLDRLSAGLGDLSRIASSHKNTDDVSGE